MTKLLLQLALWLAAGLLPGELNRPAEIGADGDVVEITWYIGLAMQDPEKLEVSSVSQGSPAQNSGFEIGDLILFADGKRVETLEQLKEVINLAEDQEMEIRFIRKGVEKLLHVTPTRYGFLIPPIPF